MHTMNAAQVKAAFERESILLGREDLVPEGRAVALFGKEAVEHCQRRCDFVVFRRTSNVEKWRVNVYSL